MSPLGRCVLAPAIEKAIKAFNHVTQMALSSHRILVRSHEDGSEEAPVDRGRVQDDGVLLVVPGVGGDGHDGVDAGGELRKAEVVHGACCNLVID